MQDLAGWMPIRVNATAAGPRVDWAYMADFRFTEPFFEQTVARCFRYPGNLLFRRETDMTALDELAKASPGLPPSGFIFHMSRCGSTLVSRMLAAPPKNIVVSEASPVDGVLRSHLRDPSVTDEQRILWLRGLLNALGQCRHRVEKNFFVKFDSWHTLFLPLIRRAFPDVPWIFMYRDPVEVMGSHQRQIGGQMIPGVLEAAMFGLNEEEIGRMQRWEYGIRVLAKICEAALDAAKGGDGRLVEYRQLPQAVPDLLRAWRVECDADAMEKMNSLAQFHAKNPAFVFADDGQAKAQSVGEDVRQLIRQWLEPAYQKLETRRLGPPST
jgi:hypothetical protein